MAMPDPPAALVDAILPYLDERLGRYRKLVKSYTRADIDGGSMPIGHEISRPLIWATPFRLPRPWTELDCRVAIAKYAVHTSLRSEKQRRLICGSIWQVIRDHRKLICGNCPGEIDHGQVLVAWVFLGMHDPFADIIGPQTLLRQELEAVRGTR